MMKSLSECNYICVDCALKNGGSWNEGYISAFQVFPCELCGIDTAVYHKKNWNLDKLGNHDHSNIDGSIT